MKMEKKNKIKQSPLFATLTEGYFDPYYSHSHIIYNSLFGLSRELIRSWITRCESHLTTF